MSASVNPTAQTFDLFIEREFAAPAKLVFEAWSSAEHQRHWMGPEGFTVPSCEIDFRVGGCYRTCIRSAEGSEYWMRGTYREIVAASRIVFTFSWEEDGERGMENVVTLTFTEYAGKTTMTFHQMPFHSEFERDSHNGGWTSCFVRLLGYVADR